MALQSMTGFSRSEGTFQDLSWTWEIRSVNGKGLDVRLRVPSGFEAIEQASRSLIIQLFNRGNLQVNLHVTGEARQSVPTVNTAVLEGMVEAAETIAIKIGGDLPTVADYLNIRGIVEMKEKELTDTERAQRDGHLLDTLSTAALSLQQTREKEGVAISSVLISQIEKIEVLLAAIIGSDDRKPKAILSLLSAQVDKLVDSSPTLDPQRLHQEAILLAAKADLQEELDRLGVHVRSAKDLIAGDGPVGRKLDFLAQELNRECNTICSKSNSAFVTSQALDMKLVIDQFREQLQNME